MNKKAEKKKRFYSRLLERSEMNPCLYVVLALYFLFFIIECIGEFKGARFDMVVALILFGWIAALILTAPGFIFIMMSGAYAPNTLLGGIAGAFSGLCAAVSYITMLGYEGPETFNDPSLRIIFIIVVVGALVILFLLPFDAYLSNREWRKQESMLSTNGSAYLEYKAKVKRAVREYNETLPIEHMDVEPFLEALSRYRTDPKTDEEFKAAADELRHRVLPASRETVRRAAMERAELEDEVGYYVIQTDSDWNKFEEYFEDSRLELSH